MSVDARLLVSSAQAVTTTAVSTDSIPLEVAGLELAAGEPLGFAFHITTAAAVAGTETYEFEVIADTNANLTTAVTVLAERAYTTAQATASLTLGKRFFIGLPVGMIPATATHIGVRYTTANSASVGVTAYLTSQQSFDDQNRTIRSGFSVAA
jgi:hypothetical protein